MNSYSTFLLITLIVPPLLILLGLMAHTRSLLDRQKSSPFECGFDPKDMARIPFSMRFFLLAVIFLVFDIELALIIPIPFLSFSSTHLISSLMWASFILVLILGTLYEWYEGSLSWMF
uniref:NADH-ubiquinone oxidoreductase chain 3 n=1 Tax=Terebratulina retusa TaxID=7580 RepID=Q9T9N3_9BILA|nr:NADH dehydrogenase subunit 3 [Terebratulina retusa]CAB59853.1 NADH dehydrogenase subunit 3 [Terebratulina retusa]